MYRPSRYGVHDETLARFQELFYSCPISPYISMHVNQRETYRDDGQFVDERSGRQIGLDWTGSIGTGILRTAGCSLTPWDSMSENWKNRRYRFLSSVMKQKPGLLWDGIMTGSGSRRQGAA